MLLRPVASHTGPRPAPVGVSLTVHMGLLAAVAFGPAGVRKQESTYRREIAPQEKKLVWYRFNDKLPDVSPTKPADAEPPRAEAKNPSRTIVSRSPRNDPAKQMTLAPAPELKIQPELAAPNLMAFEAPKPPPRPKLFMPPPQAPRPVVEPTLENAPEVASTDTRNALARLPATRLPKPPPKAFVPPAPVARKTEAPQLEASDLRLEPGMARLIPLAPIPLPRKQPPKTFTPPPPNKPAGAAPDLENAPLLSANLTAAVVGLNPVDRPLPVIPEVSRPAQFSAAPEIARTDGAAAPAEAAPIVVPGLTIRSDAPPKRSSIATLARVTPPTSRETVLAAMRPVIESSAPTPPKSSATRVSGGPDPRFEGRVVYTVVLQMPNVTSYSGSWIMWYAERQRQPGEAAEISPPTPLRKVDPIYDLSAVDERVEGKVQLSAVIHTDGYVYAITVLSGLDPRLDKNSITALRKWEFEPARRDGAPVDVDIVIEIPFRLRPRK
jgi:TonB family protein